MELGLSFWIPLLLLFLSAAILAIIQRRTRDSCLKRFHKSFVLLKLKDDRWVWGTLHVFPKSIEVVYPHPLGDPPRKLTFAMFEQNLADIVWILRPAPASETAAFTAWLQEVERFRRPSIWRRLGRMLRNLLNTLRDALSQSVTMILGVVKQRTAVGRIATIDQRATQVSQGILSAVPNAYEPILERYLRQQVLLEMVAEKGLQLFSGALQEYSDRFFLLRAVELSTTIPEAPFAIEHSRTHFDAIFPRNISYIRHRVETTDG